MAKIIIESEPKTVEFVINDKSYEVPLSGSLKPTEIASMDTVEGTVAFLKKYIPAKIVDNLTLDEYNQIVNSWGEESRKASGMSLGE